MPTTQDVKSLIDGIAVGNWYKVQASSERIAKKLIKQGHTADGEWIRDTISKHDMPEYLQNSNDNMNYHITEPTTSFDDLVLPDETRKQIQRIFKEYNKRQLLRDNGLSNANKILLVGNPGTGKTMTAEVIAHELNLPLRTIRQETVVNSLMGSTAKKLANLLPTYQEAGVFPGVYFLDEFDTFASKRFVAKTANDREYNEITNVLLKEMDHINPDCIFVAATNLSKGFDPAVFRRFDMIINFPDSSTATVYHLFLNMKNELLENYTPSDEVLEQLSNFPPSVVKLLIQEAEKAALLDGRDIDDQLFLELCKDRS